MDLVQFQHSLEDHQTTYSTIDALVQKIQSIPNHQALKLNLELTLYVCKVVENIVGTKSKTSTIDKSNMVIQVFQTLFPDLTDEQINYLKTQISYFWSNKMIKRRGLFIKYGIYTFNFLKKKFI